MNFVKFIRTVFLTEQMKERWKIVKPISLQRNFFTQVTGNRVSDHYTKNVYKKVFL